MKYDRILGEIIPDSLDTSNLTLEGFKEIQKSNELSNNLATKHGISVDVVLFIRGLKNRPLDTIWAVGLVTHC